MVHKMVQIKNSICPQLLFIVKLLILIFILSIDMIHEKDISARAAIQQVSSAQH